MDKVLCMGAGDLKVCIDVKSVLKVIMLPFLEHSPTNVTGLVGMLNYAGHNINVMDLYALLTGKRDTPYTLNNAVVITECNELITGFIIDEVFSVKEIDVSKIQMRDELKTIIFDDEIYTILSPSLHEKPRDDTQKH